MENCVNARGIKCQIIREGDNLEKIVVDAVCEETTKTIITRGENNMIVVSESTLMDKDVIGITESVVARMDEKIRFPQSDRQQNLEEKNKLIGGKRIGR